MPTRRRILGLAACLPVLGLSGSPAHAAPEVFSQMGVALSGADPVAYFTDGAPVSGRAEYGLMWRGTIWQFASDRNRAAFEMNPDGFAPQYGGYCAWAVAEGYIASSVPEAWTIHAGKLYLNYSLRVRERWLRDVDGNIARAAPNWPGLLDG